MEKITLKDRNCKVTGYLYIEDNGDKMLKSATNVVGGTMIL